MILDALTSRQRQVELFERYGVLLTEHQRRVLELYLDDDWSLSEIATSQEISRAGVHDIVRRSVQTLQEYEGKLGLLAARSGIERELTSLRRRLAALEREMASLEQEVARL
jgi:predicted DNA-binding protein YlxM (UPF0122 family)